MSKLIDMEKAEEIVSDVAKRRFTKGEVKKIVIDSSDLMKRGKYKNFEIKGLVKYEKEGLLGGEEEREFKAQVDARDGKVIKFKKY